MIFFNVIISQIEEERISPGPINIHQPRYPLLASCLLRLGHAHILSGNVEVEDDDMGRRCGLLRQGHDCFKEGVEVMEEASLTNPCLMAELLFAKGQKKCLNY